MHRKGFHCGSTAMGDALRTLGLDLPEEMIFGLGAGLGFLPYDGDTQVTPPQPSRFFVGRSATFERDLCNAVGATLHEVNFDDADDAWRHIEDVLSHDALPLVYTDLAELPYADAHAHWCGHLIAVASKDALVWDNGYAEPQRIEPLNLKAALCSSLPVPTKFCTVLHVTGSPRAGRPEPSIALNAQRMFISTPLIWAFAGELPDLQKREDWPRIARLAAQVIEVRGTGGGLFRRMYAQFLGDAGHADLAMLCKEAADAWSELARHLDQEHALACVQAEEALWDAAR
jgi:hypothetical protein